MGVNLWFELNRCIHDGFHIQECADAVLALGHALKVIQLNARAKIRWRLNVVRADLNHFLYGFHQQSDEFFFAIGFSDLNHDDTSVFILFDGSHPKAQTQIDHRDDLSAEVDDALDEVWGFWKGSDFLQADNLSHFQNRNSIGFLSQVEG